MLVECSSKLPNIDWVFGKCFLLSALSCGKDYISANKRVTILKRELEHWFQNISINILILLPTYATFHAFNENKSTNIKHLTHSNTAFTKKWTNKNQSHLPHLFLQWNNIGTRAHFDLVLQQDCYYTLDICVYAYVWDVTLPVCGQQNTLPLLKFIIEIRYKGVKWCQKWHSPFDGNSIEHVLLMWTLPLRD